MKRNLDENRLFWTNDANDQVGQILYSPMPDHATLICEEVLVNPQFRGRGIGGKIMADFVEFAKEREQKIYPLCPFALKYFQNHPELAGMNMHEQITAEKVKNPINRKWVDNYGSKWTKKTGR